MSRRFKILAIVLSILIGIPAIGFAALTQVKTGTRLICKYRHTIKENIKTIIVFRWTADEYSILTTTITCPKHERLEKLHEEAAAALKNGSPALAKNLFEQIKAIDPNFADVNTQLDRINAGTPTSPGTPATPPSPPNPVTPPPVIDLPSLLPATLTGYRPGEIDTGDNYASRDYRPNSQARMQSMLATVHSTGTQAAAEQFIVRVDKSGFPKNGKTLSVNGYAAYFGTDGTTYATLAWAKGTVVYELQAHSSSGDPAGLEQDLLAAAASFN